MESREHRDYVRKLVREGICISKAEARRLIHLNDGNKERVESIIKKKGKKK